MVEQTDNESTMINGTAWGILKLWAMQANYRSQSWFQVLTPNEVDTVERLRAGERARRREHALTPHELKQETKQDWKISVRDTFSEYKYDLIKQLPTLVLENEHWNIASRRNANEERHREIIIAVESLKGRTAIFDRNTGLLLSSFDVSFDVCY